jgi:N6-adenosine-specific RNA methylase IME4
MSVEVVAGLDEIADVIRTEQAKGRAGLEQAVESYFAIGHCLLAARRQLPSDNAFGAWMAEQKLGFRQPWAWTLRKAAEYENEVRAVIGQPMTGVPNIEKAVKRVLALHGGTRTDRPDAPGLGHHNSTGETSTAWPTIVIDPPWRYDNIATRGAAEDHYPTMSLGELADLPIPGAANGHLYLWVTNGFLRDGFDLLEAWGYRYKTVLTWCKPSIGMGNYFRNNTEHVLFAVRGSLPTLANNEPTWFAAERGSHSSKPESFYDIVERSSPGPFLEMFARRRRFGWDVWGNEA